MIGGEEWLWGAPEWIGAALGFAVTISILALWSYSRPDTSGGVRFLAGLLKIAAIALIAICLLEPMRSGTRPRPQANVLPILVDNSQSMQLKAAEDTPSRNQQNLDVLREDSDWRIRLAQAFDVRRYAFDARLESVEDFSTLQADGYVSSMATSLTSLAERFAERPVAGALLFTDGNLTDAPDANYDWSQLGFPVYPVVPESDGALLDLRIVDVSVRQTDFESAPITVTVSVDAVGISDETVFVQLRDVDTGKLIEESSINLANEGEASDVRFRFRPEESGVRFYRATAFRGRDRRLIESPLEETATKSDEATLLNNSRIVTVDRASGPYRILYLSGRPNWEFKFIRRALQQDAEVQLVGLIRIANKEPKFSFRDKGVNDTNPLFAGLGEADEESAQQYDEPVIIRLGVKESEELSEGFPDTAEELFAYHGVILDDLETDFFTQDQMLLLRRFVGSRGGGLLMLGGQEAFDSQKFGDTPLGELSPVYPPRMDSGNGLGPYAMKLTREGLLQPWARLRSTELLEQDRIAEMPPFLTLNPVGDVKPGATQLAVVESNPDGITRPALVAQRFGKGRTAALLIGDLWRWSMRRNTTDTEKSNRDDPAQAWRQISHWLVNDVPRRAELTVKTDKDPSQPVQILVNARDEAYLPMDNAKVELTIEPLGGEAFEMSATMDATEPGLYQATYWSREPGGYKVTAKVTGPDGAEIGKDQSGWTAQSGAAEFGELKLNRKLLEQIAAETGGEVIREDRLDQFAVDLPKRDVPITETWIYPIWHRPWVMFLAVLCLCGEWGLRRWKGLA
ncbi:MAG: hypothetical protein GY904_30790 [Planctomycetaceae bacterium]|nr:hypothetical protein [Planctomycetaceae bacterium]